MLRRPPLGQVLATAHDMGREHTIISALGPTDVPVPATIGLCTDDSVNGAPFYVMDFVDGRVIRSHADAESLGPDERRRAGESLVDVMAAIHAVDVDAVGLGDLGKKEDYIGRQLKRWYSQFQSSDSQVPGGIGLPRCTRSTTCCRPTHRREQGASIVHGDYRLDNCMLDDDGSVMAVLDWEICTLGDPLADVGLLWVYWSDPDDDAPCSRRPPPPPWTGSPARPSSSSGTRRHRVVTRRTWASTSPSATGSSPASSPASMPATPAAPWATCPPSRSRGSAQMLDRLAELTVESAAGIG